LHLSQKYELTGVLHSVHVWPTGWRVLQAAQTISLTAYLLYQKILRLQKEKREKL
jgi:hypothetical protein